MIKDFLLSEELFATEKFLKERKERLATLKDEKEIRKEKKLIKKIEKEVRRLKAKIKTKKVS